MLKYVIEQTCSIGLFMEIYLDSWNFFYDYQRRNYKPSFNTIFVFSQPDMVFGVGINLYYAGNY